MNKELYNKRTKYLIEKGKQNKQTMDLEGEQLAELVQNAKKEIINQLCADCPRYQAEEDGEPHECKFEIGEKTLYP